MHRERIDTAGHHKAAHGLFSCPLHGFTVPPGIVKLDDVFPSLLDAYRGVARRGAGVYDARRNEDRVKA